MEVKVNKKAYLEIALSILYVGLGGFFAGISWNKVKVWSLR